jgi:sialic acid synthase SpsE
MRSRVMTRRSAFAARDIAAGEPIDEAAVDFRRPGTGIPPTMVDRVIGTAAARAIAKGTMLSWTDLVLQ